MLLLFAIAVMDLRWVVALTFLVTSEKLLPGPKIWRLAIAAGLMAIAIGLAIAAWNRRSLENVGLYPATNFHQSNEAWRCQLALFFFIKSDAFNTDPVDTLGFPFL
jgi:hypothetical protein